MDPPLPTTLVVRTPRHSTFFLSGPDPPALAPSSDPASGSDPPGLPDVTNYDTEDPDDNDGEDENAELDPAGAARRGFSSVNNQ